MRFLSTLILGLASITFATTNATAQVTEIRVGGTEHDVSIFGLGARKGKENSGAVNADIIFSPIEALSFIGAPKPYVGGTLNLGGKTSYGGAGVLWRTGLFENTFAELAFGGVIHDGTREVPDPRLATTIEELEFVRRRERTEIEYGSRVLFRTQIALGYEINEHWAVDTFIEHLSHGNIISNGSNEGLDTYGLRLGYRF